MLNATPAGEPKRASDRPARRRSLAAQTAARLTAAGIRPDDPALTAIIQWNAAVADRNERESEAG